MKRVGVGEWSVSFALGLLLSAELASAASAPKCDSVTGTFEGDLETIIGDDFKGKKSDLVHYLYDRQKKTRTRLKFSTTAPRSIRSGGRVKVKGKLCQGVIEVAGYGDSSVQTISATVGTTAIGGALKVAIIKASYSSGAVTCSDSTLLNNFSTATDGNSLNRFYSTVSNGAVSSIASDVFSLNLNKSQVSGCDLSTWSADIDKAAQGAGINLSNYTHFVYVLPSLLGCIAGGYASLGGNRMWFADAVCDVPNILGHELGHNFGMDHAGAYDEKGVFGEYRDASCIMGSGNGLRGLNSAHRLQLGWLPDSAVTAASSGSTVRLSALGSDLTTSAYPQVAKLYDPSRALELLVSYRSGNAPYDANLDRKYVPRISFHSGSRLTTLHMTLAAGTAYRSADGSMRIKNIVSGSDSMSFDVNTAPESNPPSAAFVYPVNGWPVSQNAYQYLQVRAQDDSGIARVEFYRDGALIGSTSEPAYAPWISGLTFGVSQVIADSVQGPFTIVAKAYDADGNVASSAPVTTSILRQSSPAAGSVVSGTVSLAIDIAPTVPATITYYATNRSTGANVMLGASSTAPYSVQWDSRTLPDGTYDFYAEAQSVGTAQQLWASGLPSTAMVKNGASTSSGSPSPSPSPSPSASPSLRTKVKGRR